MSKISSATGSKFHTPWEDSVVFCFRNDIMNCKVIFGFLATASKDQLQKLSGKHLEGTLKKTPGFCEIFTKNPPLKRDINHNCFPTTHPPLISLCRLSMRHPLKKFTNVKDLQIFQSTAVDVSHLLKFHRLVLNPI